MALEIDTAVGIPEGWVMLEAVVVAECLDSDGDRRLCVRNTPGLAEWNCVGMLITASDATRESLKGNFSSSDGNEDAD